MSIGKPAICVLTAIFVGALGVLDKVPYRFALPVVIIMGILAIAIVFRGSLRNCQAG